MNPSFSCFVVGEDTLLIKCCEILLNKGHKILGIAAFNPAIKVWALERNINVYELDLKFEKVITSKAYDYLFSIANLTLLKDNIINSPQKSAINFHDGPLPKYAGINATSWALMNGEKKYAITWHEITSEIDRGDILKQLEFDIDEGEIALSLNAKCFETGAEAFEELVDELSAGTVQRIKQDFSQRTYFSKFKKPESAALIEWDSDAEKILAFVRALNFGHYRNYLTLPKIYIGDKFFIIHDIEITNIKSNVEPGKITQSNEQNINISTNTYDLKLTKVLTIDGLPISISNLVSEFSLQIGTKLNHIDSKTLERISAINKEISKKEDYWLKELTKVELIDIYYAKKKPENEKSVEYVSENLNISEKVVESFKGNEISLSQVFLSLFAIFIGRHSGKKNYTLGFSHSDLKMITENLGNLFSEFIPFNVEYDPQDNIRDLILRLSLNIEEAIKAKSFVKDIYPRYPELDNFINEGGEPIYPITACIVNSQDNFNPQQNSLLNFVISPDLTTAKLIYDSNSFNEMHIKLIKAQFISFIEEVSNQKDLPVSRVSILSIEEKKKIFEEWNNYKKDFETDICIHQLFERMVNLTPDKTALTVKDISVSYSELNKKANKIAHKLVSIGIGPNSCVGIYTTRSVEMVASIVGIHKAGAAYLPLDPDFPSDRIQFMVDDANIPVLITQQELLHKIPNAKCKIIQVDSTFSSISDELETNPDLSLSSSNLAYLIYTSGSTGKPKGVMVTHRNVVNFFSGMDDQINFNKLSVWLAVTSLSFDISVLELLWTLTRGLKLVLYTGNDFKISRSSKNQNFIDFSLFYFSSYADEKSTDKYKLLLEGSKYADENHFRAIWTPERHFYDFGGLYPNPSITSAAIASLTKNIKLRAGSVVSPLHSVIRIAEEWSMVDNLSHGRVGVSFAAGWQPNDFVIMPENFKDRKELMFKQIDEVKKLWRGDKVGFNNPNGKVIDINILPKPVQKELPVWVTAAGNPETFEMAGKMGYNLLTHLLGQSILELSEKINIYRKAWKDAGHKGKGTLTLMLHTFVGPDENKVKEIVRNPMKNYLKSAVNLVKEAAWSFPTFKNQTTGTDGNFNMDNLSSDDLDAILDYSFERYYQTSGLFGTPESCRQIISELREIDVDEIACLIDFGVNSDLVLSHLYYLNQLRLNSNMPSTEEAELNNYSIASLINNQKVTHMQCTPSLAKMLLQDSTSSEALSKLKVLLIGGEAFPVNLAKNLSQILDGDIINMYGPTETTIWSTCYKLEKPIGHTIPIGKPIANTQVYVLDDQKELIPIGIPGELCIGGDGVTDGYYERSDLTKEKFIGNPFSNKPGSKLYKTGDLACYKQDGTLEFLGRLDHQVKMRGYRIELGEIETLLLTQSDVKEVVVILREDELGDKRLVAYIVPKKDSHKGTDSLKMMLRENLPEYMIPSFFVFMDKFPLTPNGKIDRKNFPEPFTDNSKELINDIALPTSEVEMKIAEIWKDLLKLPKVGTNDNFFDIGGHSLLAVQLHSKLKQTIDPDLTLIDIFKYPTISSLVAHINKRIKVYDEQISQRESKRAIMSRQRISRLKLKNKNNSDNFDIN